MSSLVEESDLDVDDIYNYGEFAVRSFCEAQDPSFKVTEEISEGIVFEFEPDEEEERGLRRPKRTSIETSKN